MAPRDPWQERDQTAPPPADAPLPRRPQATADRFQGCLVGLAAGGSLGTLFQALSPQQGAARYQQLGIQGGPFDHAQGKLGGALPPAVTTALAMCVGRSVLARGTFDREDTVRSLLRWRRGGGMGLGGTVALALGALESGATPEEAALAAASQRGDEAADAGALAAAVPLALLDVYDPSALQWDTMLCALITHWDERATWAAIGLNAALAELLRGQREGYLERATALLEEEHVRSALLRAPFLSSGQVQPSTHAPLALQAAVWAFHHAGSFEEALRRALELGGEATTVGAVTGALAGAHWGLGAIPGRWAEALAEREELLRLAAGLHHLAEATRK